MSMSQISVYSSMNRNLVVQRAEDTDDEKRIKKLNTKSFDSESAQEYSAETKAAPANPDASITNKRVDTRNHVEAISKQDSDLIEKQAATLDVNYGAGQNVPVHKMNQTTPQDFTFDFSKKEDFQLVGARNKLEDVDVEKGISDMKKETVLDQYKYFVNPMNLGTDQDGTVKIISWD